MRAKAPPASLAAIAAALREARSVAVLSHVNPDGDAIGSQVGLGLALQAMGKPGVSNQPCKHENHPLKRNDGQAFHAYTQQEEHAKADFRKDGKKRRPFQ